MTQPNIIVVITDDQPGAIMGGELTRTLIRSMPLTQEREDLTWYPNAFCAVPLCEPDRATIFSGQYDWHHGVTNNPKDDDFVEASDIANALQAGGYKTGIYGKRFNAFPFSTNEANAYCPPGYDHCGVFFRTPKPWDYKLIEGVPGSVTVVPYPKFVNNVIFEPNYATHKIFEKALGFLDAYAPDPQQKFYLYIAPFGPHEPASPPPSDIQAITTYLPPLSSFGNVGTGAPQFFANLLPINVNTERNALRSAERGMLSVDRGLNDVFAKLAQYGRLEDTVIFFTTDQGVGYGDHKWHTKRIPYDCAVRVPFFAHWGSHGMHPGTNNAIVSHVDIVSTIAELAQVAPPAVQDGVSILGESRTEALIHWMGGNAGGKFGQTGATPSFWAIATGNYKYCELGPDLLSPGEVMLHDHTVDEFELTNVANEPAYQNVRTALANTLAELKP